MAYPPPGYAPYAPPQRRRRRWPLRLAIVLVVLVGLAVAVDRISDAVAERIAGTSIQDSQELSQRPDVSINGFPFLTQFAAAQYDSVDITAHGLVVGPSARTLTVDTLAVHLSDVTTARDFASVHAASATADARVTFADLARTLGVKIVSSDGPNRLKTSLSVSIAGQTITGSVSAAVSVSTADGLTFSDIQVDAGGTSVPGSQTQFGQAFSVPIPLSGLPFHIRVTGVSVDSAGIVVHLSGRDLEYDKS